MNHEQQRTIIEQRVTYLESVVTGLMWRLNNLEKLQSPNRTQPRQHPNIMPTYVPVNRGEYYNHQGQQ